MLPEETLSPWQRVWAYLEAQRCKNCRADNLAQGMPCPHCGEHERCQPVPVTAERRRPYLKAKAFKEVKVASGSRAGVHHTLVVDKGDKVISCSCEGFFYRKKCRHQTEYRG